MEYEINRIVSACGGDPMTYYSKTFIFQLLNDESVDGETPIDFAIENREVEAVKFCIDNGRPKYSYRGTT